MHLPERSNHVFGSCFVRGHTDQGVRVSSPLAVDFEVPTLLCCVHLWSHDVIVLAGFTPVHRMGATREPGLFLRAQIFRTVCAAGATTVATVVATLDDEVAAL